MSDFVIDHRPDGTPVFVDRHEHYLAHHGILGQKWGERNGPPYPLDEKDYSREEREQRKRAKDIKRYYKNKSYSNTKNTNKNIEAIYNSNKVLEANSKLKEVTKYSDEYMNNEDKYINKAVNNIIKDKTEWYNHVRQEHPDDSEVLIRERIKEDVMAYEPYYNFSKKEFSIDRGSKYSPYMLFMKEKGLDYKEEHDKYEEAISEMKDAINSSVDDYLGKYGDMPLNGYKKPSNSQYISDTIKKKILNDAKNVVDTLNGSIWCYAGLIDPIN